MKFEEKFKETRKQHQLSQEDLALKLHVTRQTISKWECGLSMPDGELLIQIADIFQMSIDELLCVTHKKEEESENLDVKSEQKRPKRKSILWKIIGILGFIILFYLIMIIVANFLFGISTTEMHMELKQTEVEK